MQHPPATVPQLVEIALERIRSQGALTYVEIGEILLGHGVEPSGDVTIKHAPAGVVYWQGMSQDFLAVITSPSFANRTERIRVDPATYGDAALDLPVARKPPRAGYRLPHWAPTAFRIRPELVA